MNELCDAARLPLGMTGFSDLRNSGNIYVDKTAMIYEFARLHTPLFLSRPRRFGKSLLVDTLECLFSRGVEDFHGLAIEKLWKDKTYSVVRLDFSGIADLKPQKFVSKCGNLVLKRFNAQGKVPSLDDKGEYLDPSEILDDILDRLENNSTVLLIDEYDAPLVHHLNAPDELQDIMRILNNFYAVIKEYTKKFRFIFITGVTRTAHVSIFSAFNNLEDLSLKKEYNTLLGFTQDELRQCFDPYAENAAHVLGMSKEALYARLEHYYDGFQFAIEAEETLYNPWSVLNFLKYPDDGFKNYWYESGGVSSLVVNYLKRSDTFDFMNYDDRKITTTPRKLSERYEITAIPREILLYQAGYFTIRLEEDGRLCLLPPNGEVEESLLDLYLFSNNLDPQIQLSSVINTTASKIDNHDIPGIVDVFNEILKYVISPVSNTFLHECSVRDVIFSSFLQNRKLQVFKECVSLKGFSDLEMLTNKTHMVIEFKRTYPKDEEKGCFRDEKASLKEAIEQMKSHHYGEDPFSTRTLFRVAMVISTEKKRILPEYCKEVE